MIEYLELGSSPAMEDCVQVESGKDYLPAMRDELRRYKTMLEKMFPIPDNVQAWFVIKYFPHDFGTYGEVRIVFIADDDLSSEFACNVEDNLPDMWE